MAIGCTAATGFHVDYSGSYDYMFGSVQCIVKYSLRAYHIAVTVLNDTFIAITNHDQIV